MTFTPPESVGPVGGPAHRAFGLPGPEVLGSLASLGVLVLLGAFLLPGMAGTGGVPEEPSPSPRIGSPSIAPSATPTVPRPPWSSDAEALLDVDARVLELADGLSEQLDPVPSRGDEIARSLRAINTRLAFALEVIIRLEGDGMPTGLVNDLREAHTTALEASQSTLRASVSNVAAYVEGGSAVVEALTVVEALQDDLASESGQTLAP